MISWLLTQYTHYGAARTVLTQYTHYSAAGFHHITTILFSAQGREVIQRVTKRYSNYRLVLRHLRLVLKKCHCVTDWVTNWLTDWVTNWVTDWVTDWITDWVTD